MGEIIGLGMTHYPGMTMQGNLSSRAKSFMKDPLLPAEFQDPATWPEPMQIEWSNDEGLAHSDRHRQQLIENFRWIRSELDAFNPDFVLLWGDDQYANFKESIVPPFAVLAYPEFDIKPWGHLPPGRVNSWHEPADKAFHQLFEAPKLSLLGSLSSVHRSPGSSGANIGTNMVAGSP